MKIKNILFAIVVFTGVHHSASAQQENLDRIRDKFRKAGEVNRQEKLFVHTDKAFYLAGEIVWFKLYAEQQSLLSSIAYVDLLDVTGKTVLAARISLQDQKDNGSMLLPLSLSSGNYKLRAYTSNMRNLAEESFFEQPITVINPFREPTPANPVHTNAHEAAFFPEGGNLVKGLESKLAFKVTDHYGNGIDCSGEIVDISGKTIVGFSSLKFGMGQLLFTPVSQGYRAIIRTAGDTFSVSLPEVMENGYVMSVQKVAGNMEVTVKSTHTAPHYISLVSRHHDRLLTTQSSLISNGRLTFTIPENKLGAGVNQLTLFDATNIPVCERLVFIPPPVTSIAGTSTDKKVYSTREQVNISVNTNDTARRAVPANLSLAVVPVDSFNASDAADIRSYFWMSADLKGHIESPSYYFGTPSPELETATENLMLTHGWRRFNWKRILNPSVTSNRFPVEAGTQEIKVKVTGKRNNQPASGQQVFLSVPGSDFSFSTALTDEEGIATFHIKEVFGSRQLVFQTDNSDEDYRFELVNEFHPPTAEAIPAFRFDANTGLLEKYSINMQVQNIYSADSMRIFYEHRSTDTIPFYGRGIQYNLDAYTRFTTMEEVIREYVREVNVVSRNGKLYMRILDEPRKEFNEDDLLVLWDGVPLKDPHQVFNMDPLKVKKLEVVPGRFAAGAAFFKGIASFSTYQGDLAGYSLPKAVSATEFEGLQLQREFYSPSYPDAAAKDRRIPDFRNTLFWVPDVNTGHQGNTALQFYTSDRTGKYLVVLQGLDADGNPLVSYFSFEVK